MSEQSEWRCTCGYTWVALRKFCGECGAERPKVQPEIGEDMKIIGELRAAYWVARGRADSGPLDKLNKEAEYAWMMVLAKARDLLGQEAEKLRAELATERAMKKGCQHWLLRLADVLNELGVGLREDENTVQRAERALREQKARIGILECKLYDRYGDS